MFHALPFSPQQADYTFYRQDPNVSNEVLLHIPEFPPRLAGQREALERFARNVVQQGHNRNAMRMFVYNQMSAQNWQNNDWIALVKNLGMLLEFLIFDQNKQGNSQLVGEAVEIVVKFMMLRAAEQYPELLKYIDQTLYNELTTIQQTREKLRALMNQVSSQQPMNQNQQLLQIGNTANWGGAQQQHSAPLQSSTGGLGGGTSSRISISDFAAPARNTAGLSIETPGGILESWDADPNERFAKVGGGHTEFAGFFRETEEVRITPKWEEAPPAATQAPQEVDYRQEIINKFGALFPMMTVGDKDYPLVYDRHRYQLTEKGTLMKQEDHVIEQMEIPTPAPSATAVPTYKAIDSAAPESNINTRVGFLKATVDDGLILLPDSIVGLEIDTAAGLVNYRTNAYIDQKVVEFSSITVDAVFVPDVAEFKKEFAGLLVDSPETDITKLMELVKASGQTADSIFRKLNRRVTRAINRIMTENMGLEATITDGASDFMELPAWINKKKGSAYLAAFNDCVMGVVNAAACVTDGLLDDTVREYNMAKFLVNQGSGLKYDGANYVVRAIEGEELEASDTEVRASCAAACLTPDSFIQLIYRDYVSLLPVEFANLGIDLADNEVNVVHYSAHPELNTYLKEFYRRAGGDSSRFDNLYITTIDGALLRLVRLALADDTVLGLVREF